MKEQRTNIMFPTTKCNMYCDYCYEEASRNDLPEQIEMTNDIIDKYLYEISDREKGITSTVVIMGGEALLKPKLLKYIIKKMSEIDHSWGVCLTTNSTLIKDGKILNDIMEYKNDNVYISLEMSYDCSGHYRRKFRNSGKPTKEIVEKAIDTVLDMGLPVKVSYTVHKGNYENFIKDMVYISERWSKNSNFIAIKLSPYFQELTECFGEGSFEKLEPIAKIIQRKTGVQICQFTCDVCGMCDRSKFVGNAYFNPKGTNVQYEPKRTEKAFDRWK